MYRIFRSLTKVPVTTSSKITRIFPFSQYGKNELDLVTFIVLIRIQNPNPKKRKKEIEIEPNDVFHSRICAHEPWVSFVLTQKDCLDIKKSNLLCFFVYVVSVHEMMINIH